MCPFPTLSLPKAAESALTFERFIGDELSLKRVLRLLCSGGAGLGMMLENSKSDGNNEVLRTKLTAFSPSKSAAAACSKVGLPTSSAPPVRTAIVSAAAKPKPLALLCTVT